MYWQVSNANLKETKTIQKLVNFFSKKDLTVPVRLTEITDNLENFVVVRNGKEILGCGQLAVYRRDVAELRSVCVRLSHQRKGIGTSIVKGLMVKARNQKINHVVIITKSPGFWDKIGFLISDRQKHVRIKSVSKSTKFI